MNGDGKYMRLGRRVVRMHAPVGKRPECWTYEYEGVRDMQWCFCCGYGVCSKVGRCAPRPVVEGAYGYYAPAPVGWTLDPMSSRGYAVYRNGPLTITKAPDYAYMTPVDGGLRAYRTVEEACAAALRNTPCS